MLRCVSVAVILYTIFDLIAQLTEKIWGYRMSKKEYCAMKVKKICQNCQIIMVV